MPEAQSAISALPEAPQVFNRRQLLSMGRLNSARSRADSTSDWIRISRAAMACRFEVILAAESGVAAAQACLDEVDRLEAILSIFRPESEVSRLNCRAGNPVTVGPELYDLLLLCKQLQDETEGAFDVTTGALSECWGFQQRKPRIPDPGALATARERIGFQHISLGSGRTVTDNSPGLRLNFGGVGKGYALDRAARKILDHGIATALLSAGSSSVSALGAGPEGRGWMIGLRHPVYKDRNLGSVRLRSCAMATSGQEEQWFEAEGMRYGHILDPRTGSPARGVMSVSVIADSAARADALTTAFFVAGPEFATCYCDAHDGMVAVMLMEQDLSHPIVIGNSDQAIVEVVNE